jgi:hypothetical protein
LIASAFSSCFLASSFSVGASKIFGALRVLLLPVHAIVVPDLEPVFELVAGAMVKPLEVPCMEDGLASCSLGSMPTSSTPSPVSGGMLSPPATKRIMEFQAPEAVIIADIVAE